MKNTTITYTKTKKNNNKDLQELLKTLPLIKIVALENGLNTYVFDNGYTIEMG